MKRALFLGRFQPFHKGHYEVAKKLMKEYDELIIVLGSAQASDCKENPFTYDERNLMIEKCLGKKNYQIIPVDDINDDAKYVSYVEKKVPKFDAVYCGNDNARKLFREKGYETHDLRRIDCISATEVRKRILKDANWKELLPKEVVLVIEEISGVERIKELNCGVL